MTWICAPNVIHVMPSSSCWHTSINQQTDTMLHRAMLLPWLRCSTLSVFLSSYTWFVPIKWMKSGVEQEQYWLLQKSGIVTVTHTGGFVMVLTEYFAALTSVILISLTRHQQSDESVGTGLGAAEHQRIWILQGELWWPKLGSSSLPAQHQPSGESHALSHVECWVLDKCRKVQDIHY